jgi:hypothetical protein
VSDEDENEESDDGSDLENDGFLVDDGEFDEFSDTELDDDEKNRHLQVKRINNKLLRDRRKAMVQQTSNVEFVMTRDDQYKIVMLSGDYDSFPINIKPKEVKEKISPEKKKEKLSL